MDKTRSRILLAANAADELTQKARLEACKGKYILWFTSFYTSPGYRFGVREMLDSLTGLGLKYCIVLDPDLEPDRKMAEMMKDDGLLEHNSYVFADISDPDKAVDNVMDAIHEKRIRFDASFGTSEHVQHLAAIVGERLGLPHNPSRSYTIARDKGLARKACEGHCLPSPRYEYMTSVDDAERIAEVVGFPCVVKPSSGCASMGVKRCNNAFDLCREYKSIVDDLQTNRMYTWNPGMDFERRPKVLVEQYIDGDEFDVDLLMWDGEVVYSNVMDNWPCIEPFFQEVAAHCPTLHTDKEQILKDYAANIVKAMEFRQGAFHVECKWSNSEGQPFLVEVNPRMGGGGTRMSHKDCYGVDLFENFLMTALGIPINPPRSLVPMCGRVYYDVNALKTGVLAHTRWLDHLKGHPNVTHVIYRKDAGEKVQGIDTGMPDWVANIRVKAPTIEEALDLMREFEQTISCPLLANDGKLIEIKASSVSTAPAKTEATAA